MYKNMARSFYMFNNSITLKDTLIYSQVGGSKSPCICENWHIEN